MVDGDESPEYGEMARNREFAGFGFAGVRSCWDRPALHRGVRGLSRIESASNLGLASVLLGSGCIQDRGSDLRGDDLDDGEATFLAFGASGELVILFLRFEGTAWRNCASRRS